MALNIGRGVVGWWLAHREVGFWEAQLLSPNKFRVVFSRFGEAVMDCMLAGLVLEFAMTLSWIWFHDGAGWDARFELKQVTFGIATISTLWWEETALLHTFIFGGTLTVSPTGLAQAFPLICDVKTAYLCCGFYRCYRLRVCHITICLSNTEVTHFHDALLLLSLWFLGHVYRVVFGCVVGVVGRSWRLFYICYANHCEYLRT